ncbi:Ras family protein [Hirsutella rhossiliensis]
MSSEEHTQRIMEWCHGVPTRYERDDPFAGDDFQAAQTGAHRAFEDPDRPVVNYPSGLPPRPSARLSFVRPDTPMHGSSASSRVPTTSEEVRDSAGSSSRKQKLFKALSLFSRKRRNAGPASPPLAPPPPPTPPKPVRLNFLFVGSRGTGQTSLLLWETLNRPSRSAEEFGNFIPFFRAQRNEGAMANLDSWAQPIALWILPGRTRAEANNDTSGAPDLNTVERLASMPWHGVFLCFDLGNKITLLAIVQWATANARSIRADHYIEVSARTGENIDLLLNGAGVEATRRVIARRAAEGGAQ